MCIHICTCAYPCELDLGEGERLGLPLYGRHPPRVLHPAHRRHGRLRHVCRRHGIYAGCRASLFLFLFDRVCTYVRVRTTIHVADFSLLLIRQDVSLLLCSASACARPVLDENDGGHSHSHRDGATPRYIYTARGGATAGRTAGERRRTCPSRTGGTGGHVAAAEWGHARPRGASCMRRRRPGPERLLLRPDPTCLFVWLWCAVRCGRDT
jgi:hypothetical protein